MSIAPHFVDNSTMLALRMKCKINTTFGRSRIWLASSKSSSRLREYLKMSSGTVGSEQWRLSTYSTWRLQPLKIGIQRNMTSQKRITLHIIINSTLFTNTTLKNFSQTVNIGTPHNTHPRFEHENYCMHENDVITPRYTCNTHHCDDRATIYPQAYGTSKSSSCWWTRK